MEYAVVTKLPDDPVGNLATALGSLHTSDGRPVGIQAIGLRVSVFTLGEIMVLEGGREPFGRGRKPSKWDVRTEEFINIDEAIARATEIMREGG